MKILSLEAVPNEYYDILAYPKEGKCSDVLLISRHEAENYYEAAKSCFEALDNAAGMVIRERKYDGFGIPEYLWDVIEDTYDNDDLNPHMIGRFDFAGGLDGVPIKLIEFNADTPFGIFEAAVVQYGLTKANGYDPDNRQFNDLFEALKEYFKYIKKVHVAVSGVFTSAEGGEDELNAGIIMEAAAEEIPAEFLLWSDLGVDSRYGLCRLDENGIIANTYSALFKMVPFDMMLERDPHMLKALAELYEKSSGGYRPLLIGNPFYSLVYQSKELMRVAWEMYPDNPYLLRTTNSPDGFDGSYVKKASFGREGDDVAIYLNGALKEKSGRETNSGRSYVYQNTAEFNRLEDRLYQAGVYLSMGEPCCLSFRRSDPGKKIIVSDSDLCGHLVEE